LSCSNCSILFMPSGIEIDCELSVGEREFIEKIALAY
jgi:hypothetical protein